MSHLIIRIYGRVQGIGFRFAAHEQAKEIGVTCNAQNEPDGSVKIEAEGDRKKLEKFLMWCKKGPLLAKVERVEPVWSDIADKSEKMK